MGLAQLANLSANVAHRQRMMALYQDELREVAASLEVVPLTHQMKPSGYKCIALTHLEDRETFRKVMGERFGVLIARGVYDLPIHRQPLFSRFAESESFPLADAFANSHLCLPLWRTLGVDDVKYVARSIKQFCSETIAQN